MSKRDPVRMTEPLDLKELSKTELEFLSEMNAVIREIGASKRADSDKACAPWGRVERERTNNVLFIDGDRGHGKTTLFLTLLDGWHRSWKRSRGVAALPVSPLDKEAGFLVDGLEIGCRVRFLDILDFDPMPDGMSVHAWLIGAWRKAAQVADKHGTPSGGRSACDEAESCCELWEKVMRRAIISWSKPTGATNIVSQALDRKQQIEDWSVLRRDWQKMVDSVVKQLTHAKKFRDDAVIVIPIDDVDLQVERIAELLPALRLFDHPRVVYLLTGHLKHLEEMLRLDLHGRQVRLGGRIRHKCVEACTWAKSLSLAAVEKTIPSSQIWFMDKPTLSDALKVLSKVKGVVDQLHLLIGGPLMEIRPLSYRALQRLSEELEVIRGQGNGDEKNLAYVALARLIGASSPKDGVNKSPTKLALRHKFNGHLLANGIPYLSLREGGGDVNVCFSAEVEFRFRPNRSERGAMYDAEVIAWVQALSAKFPGVVGAGGIDWDPNAVLAWSEVKAKSLTGVFVWPWAKNPEANELVARGIDWQKVIDASSGANERIAFLAYAWVLMQPIWTEGKELTGEGLVEMEALAKQFGSKPSVNALWRILLRRAVRHGFAKSGQPEIDQPASEIDQPEIDQPESGQPESGQSESGQSESGQPESGQPESGQPSNLTTPAYLDEWYRERLPAMAAPEFGLPREVQHAILEAYQEYLVMPYRTSRSLAELLNRNRRAWMGDALYREAEYRDPETLPEHTTEQEEQLLKGIDDRAHDAPWYKLVEEVALTGTRKGSSEAQPSADQSKSLTEEQLG